MATPVKKTISLPPELAREAEQIAQAQGKTLSAVVQDEPDNRVLECAAEGDADLIVTGDRAMLALGEYQGIPIISLATYLGSIPPSS